MQVRTLFDRVFAALGLTSERPHHSTFPRLVDLDRPDADEDWLNDPLGCMREAQFGDSCV